MTVAFSHPAPNDIYGGLIETVGKMVEDGMFQLRPLITHELPFGQVMDLEKIILESSDYLKGVVTL